MISCRITVWRASQRLRLCLYSTRYPSSGSHAATYFWRSLSAVLLVKTKRPNCHPRHSLLVLVYQEHHGEADARVSLVFWEWLKWGITALFLVPGQSLACWLDQTQTFLARSVRILSHNNTGNHRKYLQDTKRAQNRHQKSNFFHIQIQLCLLLELSGITNIFYFLKISGRIFFPITDVIERQ